MKSGTRYLEENLFALED